MAKDDDERGFMIGERPAPSDGSQERFVGSFVLAR